MPQALPVEIQLRACEMYRSGHLVKEIMEELGISKTGVQNCLKRQGVKPDRGVLTAELKESAVKMYKEGVSTSEIITDLGICESSLNNILAEYKIKRCRLKKYSVNRPDFFQLINSEEKAYFLGWMVSDGYISKNNGKYVAIGLGVLKSDDYILERFKKSVGWSGPIYHPPVKNPRRQAFSRVHILSPVMVKDLAKYGVIPKKSSTTFYPKIGEDPTVNAAFIRGLFEGDGCASNGIFVLFGTYQLLLGVSEALAKFTGIKVKKPYQEKGFLHYLQYGKKSDIKNIYEFLYGSASPDLVLTRKREKLLAKVEKPFVRGVFSFAIAEEIRDLHQSGFGLPELAEMYNMSMSHLKKIINNQRWAKF